MCSGCSTRSGTRSRSSWKEIIDYLEETTDRCEDVADLLEGIVPAR
jgi:uncharacterized protein Yka (UPF0111/DUF47 family)